MYRMVLLLAAAAGVHMVASDATNTTPPIYAIAGFGGSGTRAVRGTPAGSGVGRLGARVYGRSSGAAVCVVVGARSAPIKYPKTLV